ncbi:8890_t:CDS:2 [Acaulospora morrowiae]|uniref:8890_t:CDS:1 n=1 Tax=Acaulospora morrowiae TaxID=94023 RepID=A0A9N9DR30_9GLOM|nr:8890_t:CDS:2 [Acaulospora morrowiae]
MDTFLNDAYKKSVSNGIRQRNREKKLLHESKSSDKPATEQRSSIIYKERSGKYLQDVLDFTVDESDKSHMTKFSLTGHEENSDALNNIARLYDVCNAKDKTIKANQAEILCWCDFIIGLDKSVDEIMIKEKVDMKKAKGQIYNFILAHNPGTKQNTLYQRISRARKIYEFIEKIGIDKIKYIKTYSANSIAELSDSKIQTIIDYFSKNLNTELLNKQDDSIIDSEEEVSDDQINASEAVSAEVKISIAPIPLTHFSNSSDDSSEFGPVNSPKAEDDFDKIVMEAFKESFCVCLLQFEI